MQLNQAEPVTTSQLRNTEHLLAIYLLLSTLGGLLDLKSAMKEGENWGTDDPKNLTSIISVFQRPELAKIGSALASLHECDTYVA